jgi:choline dehydrogenase-like flavoprotein
MARDILAASGAKKVFKSWHFAAHPGGSVRIGEALDANLETPTRNLFVCDASAIPQPWGLPPTLTLLCLGQRLGEHLDQYLDQHLRQRA